MLYRNEYFTEQVRVRNNQILRLTQFTDIYQY